jgi:4-amino-4-deoxy-L-arabinose transferase-like glycosyltransferase
LNRQNFLLLLLALTAVAIVILATRFGIGITSDSTVYLEAGRNLLNGRGLIALTAKGELEPLTHYPPLYPAILALLTRVGFLLGGLSIESTARVLNSFLFSANVLLVGIALRRYARDSYWLPILGALLTLTAPDIIAIHTFALTEGLFIFLGLSGLVFLSRFIDTDQRAWLIASAAVIALALLTRYVGVTLALTGVLVLLFVNGRTLRRRCSDALFFGLIACAPMALWAVRNMGHSSGMTDREFGFHPVRLRQIVAGFSTVSTWLLLGKVRTDYRIVVFVAEVVAASLFVIHLLRRTRASALGNKEHPDIATADEAGTLRKRRSSLLPIIILVFIVAYVAFLIFTAFFVDADTVLDHRTLVPVHVAAIILICALAWKVFATLREVRPPRIAFVALAIILLGSYSIRLGGWLIEARQDGQGYASRAWKESKTIARVKNLPAGVTIYSNGYDAIYYLTGRPAIYLPEKTNHNTGRPNENYETEVEEMRRDLEQGKTVLVYLKTLPERWFLPSEAELVQRLRPRRVEPTVDGSILSGAK